MKFLDYEGLKYLYEKIKARLEGKVDKITGKALSTNDYTTAEKNKLAGVAANANNYVHPTASGNRHIPSGGTSGQILRWSADGTAIWGADQDTNYTLGSFGINAAAVELNHTKGVTSPIQTQLNNKAATTHNHTKNQITDFPTSFPANGGTADYTKYFSPQAIDTNTDLNSLTTPGVYYCAANATVTTLKNCPTTNAFYLTVGKHAGVYQEIVEYVQAAPKRYMRNYYSSGGWGSWYRVFTTSNPPTYSEVGALAAGGTAVNAEKVNGLTVQTAVPAGAKFTDTIYTHPAYAPRLSGLYKITVDATGHISLVAEVVKADITALGIPGQDTNTTYSVFTAAASGLTPASGGGTTKYLRADGSWQVPPDTNTTYTLGSFGITATAAELNYTKGVTSAIQTQLNGKAAASHTHEYLPLSGGTLAGDINFSGADRKIKAADGKNVTLESSDGRSSVLVSDSGLALATSGFVLRVRENDLTAISLNSGASIQLLSTGTQVTGGLEVEGGLDVASQNIPFTVNSNHIGNATYSAKCKGGVVQIKVSGKLTSTAGSAGTLELGTIGSDYKGDVPYGFYQARSSGATDKFIFGTVYVGTNSKLLAARTMSALESGMSFTAFIVYLMD